DACDARRLAERPGAHARELLARLPRERAQLLRPDRVRKLDAIHRGRALGRALLALDVAAIARAHLETLGPRCAQRGFDAHIAQARVAVAGLRQELERRPGASPARKPAP